MTFYFSDITTICLTLLAIIDVVGALLLIVGHFDIDSSKNL
jgi:hypothetical protein